MTVTDHLRNHLYASLGYAEPAIPQPPFAQMLNEEVDREFFLRVFNRLVMGRFRYGSIRQPDTAPSTRPLAIVHACVRYHQTGNLEALADIAALAAAEYSRSAHPRKHWAPTDDQNHWNAP